MDAQLRRGILDVCVLAALKKEDSYGYKIIKDLSDVIVLSESTLYTILKRLIEAKMVETRVTEFEGRIRKYYHITSVGLARIEEFKSDAKELVKLYTFITEEKL
jgi:PadR family transcriptional regulator PadR